MGLMVLLAVGLAGPRAQATPFAYIPNAGKGFGTTLSVIDTATNTVLGTPISVGVAPVGVAVHPAGTRVYVTNDTSANVSVIDTATNTVTATIPVGQQPQGVAVHPVGTRVYVANRDSFTVSVIDTATNTVTATIPVGRGPEGVAVHPAGTRLYVTNLFSATVSVIDTATNTVTATIAVGQQPFGVAVHPAGTRVYVANSGSNTVSVIDTATNTVTATIPVGSDPVAFGQFIGGTPLTPVSRCAWGLYLDDHTTGGSWEARLFLANIDPQQAHTYEVVVLATDTVRRTSLRLGPNGILQVTCGDVPACGAAGWLSVQSDASVFAATLFVLNTTLGGGSFTAQTPLCVFGMP